MYVKRLEELRNDDYPTLKLDGVTTDSKSKRKIPSPTEEPPYWVRYPFGGSLEAPITCPKHDLKIILENAIKTNSLKFEDLKLIEIDLNNELKLLNKRMTNFDAAIETAGMHNDLFKRKKEVLKQLKYIQKQKRRFWACLALLISRMDGDVLNEIRIK